ncbi:MAG: cupin domain-containing protein [Janthinobacterium lividum]
MTADEIKRVLRLEPHPREGGWFVQTYASEAVLPASVFANSSAPAQYPGPRRLSTAIYYLLEPETFSEMHRLGSDEVFHHYAGGSVEMLQLFPGGRIDRVILGKDLAAGERPQIVVPRGVWQGSRLLRTEGGEDAWALLGCTVSPGFEYADYETGTSAELLSGWPEVTTLIRALTQDQTL